MAPQLRVQPTHSVAANDKVRRIENVIFDEIQHRTVSPRSLWLH